MKKNFVWKKKNFGVKKKIWGVCQFFFFQKQKLLKIAWAAQKLCLGGGAA